MTIGYKGSFCFCLSLLALFFLSGKVSRLSAGLYGEARSELRQQYSGNEHTFTVGGVTRDPTRSNTVIVISLDGVLIHLRKDIYERWYSEHGPFRPGDKISADGSWDIKVKGKSLADKKPFAKFYNIIYEANFIARRLTLLERSEETENREAPSAEGEETDSLEEDISVHSAEAEQERIQAMGANLAISALEKEFSSQETEHFRVYYSGDEANARQAGRYFEILYEKFAEVVDPLGVPLHPPAEKMAAVIFKDFDEYRKMTGIETSACPGFYSPRWNALYIYDYRTHPGYQELKSRASTSRRSGSQGSFWNRSGQRLSELGVISICDRWIRELNAEVVIHEATHQICYNTGFFTQTGEVYPTWLVEGVALYFEHPAYWNFLENPAGNINVSCLKIFREGLALRTLVSLLDLLAPGTNFFHSLPDRTEMAYAQSWALFYYLIHGEEGKYRPGLGELIRHLNQTPAGAELKNSERVFLFRKFIKVHPLHFERQWHEYMNELREDALFIPSEQVPEK